MKTIQNQLVKAKESQIQDQSKQSVNQIMNAMLDGEKLRTRFNEILGKRTPQFISSIVSAVNADPNLTKAFYESPMSVIQAGLKAAIFDLPIDANLGYSYIVPFTNNKKQADGTWIKKTEAVYMLGWKGMHQLALRTGAYKTINVLDIREGELQSYNRLTEEADVKFIEDEDARESLPVVGYLGYYRLVNGAEKTIYMTVKQIENHEKKYRKGDKQGKGWRDDWDAMARKTVYRKLIGKWGVMSIEYQSQGEDIAQTMQEEFQLEADNPKQILDADITIVESVDTETGEVVTNE